MEMNWTVVASDGFQSWELQNGEIGLIWNVWLVAKGTVI